MSFTDAPDFDANAPNRDSTIPRFYIEARPNAARSEREGHPCFDDVEFVEILVPGDRLNVSVQIVKDDHKKRWPKAYAAFKENQEAPADGTPLDQLPGMTRSQVEELRYFHVKTIEQLAELNDAQLTKAVPMGGHPLREKAQRWVAATAGAAPDERLAAENRELRANMDTMAKNMADMQAALEKLQSQRSAPTEEPAAAPAA